MIDGMPLIDAHLHPVRLPTLKMPPQVYAREFDRYHPDDIHDEEGRIVPERFDAYLESEGVDVAVVMCEYSSRVTEIQPVEDMLPLIEYNLRRFHFLANVTPCFHYPVAQELKRQLSLGAVGLKVHPVHQAFAANDRMLYPAYAIVRSGAAGGSPLRDHRVPRGGQQLHRSCPHPRRCTRFPRPDGGTGPRRLRLVVRCRCLHGPGVP